jgi:hypothetical protein
LVIVLLKFLNLDNSIGLASIFAADLVVNAKVDLRSAANGSHADQLLACMRGIGSGHAPFIHPALTQISHVSVQTADSKKNSAGELP